MCPPKPTNIRQLTKQETVFTKAVLDSPAIDFDGIGKLVSEIGPQLQQEGVAAGDYVAKGYESAIHVYKLHPALPGLGELESLRGIQRDINQ